MTTFEIKFCPNLNATTSTSDPKRWREMERNLLFRFFHHPHISYQTLLHSFFHLFSFLSSVFLQHLELSDIRRFIMFLPSLVPLPFPPSLSLSPSLTTFQIVRIKVWACNCLCPVYHSFCLPDDDGFTVSSSPSHIISSLSVISPSVISCIFFSFPSHLLVRTTGPDSPY